MTDRRRNRGPHPADRELFAPEALRDLARAVDDLCWLLSRGYRLPSALALVGDRYRLRARQRLAVQRCTCSDEALHSRARRRVRACDAAGRDVVIDGFNVLTTVEAALAGGVILRARDGCLRDLASVHGTWRTVAQTERAIALVGERLQALEVAGSRWLLDRPVSNSGRLAATLRAAAAERGWRWEVAAIDGVDAALRTSTAVVASADSGILDRCGAWLDLSRLVVEAAVPEAWLVPCTGGG